MLFTIIACSVFLFLALTTGNWLWALFARKFRSSGTSVFQNFLCGFAFISCYLNIWSLFLPVNFYALAPVFLLTIFLTKYSGGTIDKIRTWYKSTVSSSLAIIVPPILFVIIVYALLPPQHGDSPGYHFLTIRWNETFKVVPGLANLHGRLGFNSSFFTSSAAFAFTSVAKQPLYVLNIACATCYYLWLINKIFCYRSNFWSIIFAFVALTMFRQLIDSISSPTPDVFSTIIISYIFITIIEGLLLNFQMDEGQRILLLLLICFAITVKLNTFPLSLIGLFLFVRYRMYKSRKAVLIILSGCSLILSPWIFRNYILTGYLVFPVSVTGFFHPDWKVPYEILHYEKLLINNGPKLISQNWEEVDALSFTQWFPLWLKAHFEQGLTISLLVLFVAIVCAIVSIVMFRKKHYSSLFWLSVINLASVCFWMYNSPDYRFGYPYLVNAILLFVLFLTRTKRLTFPIKTATAIVVVVICGYYIVHGIAVLSPYPVSSYMARPLEAPQYKPGNQLSDFPFIMLNDKVKLYVEDKDHWCNMAALPCYIPFTDSIPATRLQLRGNGIAEGFRIVTK